MKNGTTYEGIFKTLSSKVSVLKLGVSEAVKESEIESVCWVTAGSFEAFAKFSG